MKLATSDLTTILQLVSKLITKTFFFGQNHRHLASDVKIQSLNG